jgi:hypothetical protein
MPTDEPIDLWESAAQPDIEPALVLTVWDALMLARTPRTRPDTPPMISRTAVA